MRRLVYSVASSLDGYIAGPNGEHDWIMHDPEVDFGALLARFDTLVMGRRTWEKMQSLGGAKFPGVTEFVISRTLDQKTANKAVVSSDPHALLTELKARSGKEIWLFGGGGLFASLLSLKMVDRIEVAIMPVLLGGGASLAGACAGTRLTLEGRRVYENTGVVQLDYAINS